MKTTQYLYVLLTPVLAPLITAFILRFILTKKGYTGRRLLLRRFSSKRVMQISLPLLISSIALVICIQKLISYGVSTNNILQIIWLVSLLNSIMVILVNIAMIPLSTPDAYEFRSARWFFWVLRIRKSDLDAVRNRQHTPTLSRGTQPRTPPKPLTREQFLNSLNNESKQTNNRINTITKKFKPPKKSNEKDK